MTPQNCILAIGTIINHHPRDVAKHHLSTNEKGTARHGYLPVVPWFLGTYIHFRENYDVSSSYFMELKQSPYSKNAFCGSADGHASRMSNRLQVDINQRIKNEHQLICQMAFRSQCIESESQLQQADGLR